MKNRKTAAILAGAGANAILGFNFILQKIIDNLGLGVTPLTILAYQCTVCVIVLTLCIPIAKPDFKKMKAMGVKGLFPLALMGICDPLLYYIGTHYAIQSGASSLYVSVMVAMMPVFALIFGALLLKEIPTFLQIIFSVLSVVGVVLYTLIAARTTTEGAGVVNLQVILFLMLTVAAGVGYGMVTRKSSSDLGAFERTYGCFVTGMVLVDILALIEHIQNPAVIFEPLQSSGFVICILLYGVFAFALEYTAYNYSMNYLPASQAMIFSGVSTVVTFVASALMFPEERADLWLKLGCVVLILVGVFGAQLFGRKEEQPQSK